MLTIDLFEELEGPPEPTLIDALRDFLPLAVKHLKMEKLPKIKLLRDVETDHMPSFGKFSNDDRTVHLGIKNRHPNDILRTLAHEMIHYVQGEQDRLDADSGATGSTEEDEANAEAGVIMRKFNQQFPQYMELKPIVFEEWTQKYKKSINCSNPKGFSQRAHCAGRKKANENFADGKGPELPVDEATTPAFDPKQALDQIAKNIDLVLQKEQFQIRNYSSPRLLDVQPVLKLTKDAVNKTDPKTSIGKYFTLLHNQVYRVARMPGTPGSRDIGTAGMEARHALAGIQRDTIPAIQQLLNQSVKENFADGKNPQDKGDSQRHGIPKGATMAQLEKAAKAPGRKGQLARWQINMRRGKKK